MRTVPPVIKCLDCDTVVSPEGKWEQCHCGHLYVDTSGEVEKIGFLDANCVEDMTPGQAAGPKKKVEKSKDKFTESGTF